MVLSYPSGAIVQQLRELKVPVLVLPAATTFAAVYSQLAELAAATGHGAAVGAVEASMKEDISAATHKAGSAARGDSYYIEIDPTYYTATSKTFIGAEFSLFGMRDIADPAGRLSAYPQISAEYILKTNPDYVFLADTVCCQQTPAGFAHRPGFSVLARSAAPPRDRGERLRSLGDGPPHHRNPCRLAGRHAALVTLTADAKTSDRQAPPLDDIDGPTRLRCVLPRLTVGHVVLGAGFLLAAAIVSILVGPAGYRPAPS